jgi:uncharacterized repeat protein (TIGR01451 family)
LKITYPNFQSAILKEDQMTKHTLVPSLGTLRGAIILLGMLVALVVGLALARPAHGSTLSQVAAGDITGQATLAGQNAAGITVELRKRSNGGDDALLASAKTDGTGTYHFAGQPSAPNDAFYYVRFLGAKGALSAWYSFPIIYIMGTEVAVPAVELADVEVTQLPNATVALPVTLHWKARKMGETYRLFVYTEGTTDKPVLDSGTLGTGTEFALAEGSLPDGKYEALVQVRDTVVGYGQSQSRFHFTVAANAPQPPQSDPQQSTEAAPPPGGVQVAPANPPAQQGDNNAQPKDQPKEEAPAQADVKLNLSSDKANVTGGDTITYKVEVENAGAGAANGLVVTDKLPAGVTLSPGGIKSSLGKVSADTAAGTVTVNVDSLAPGSKATIEIPVSVRSDAGGNLSNQASANYDGAQAPVQSNAYIAQVAAPLAGPAQQPASGQPAASQQGSVQAPASGQPAQPPASQPQQPASAPKSNTNANTQSGANKAAPAAPAAPPAKAPVKAPAQKSSAAVPQTGGSFPIVLALVLLTVTLLARYLRGLKPRQA